MKEQGSNISENSDERIAVVPESFSIKGKFLRQCGCASILIVDDSPFNLFVLQEIFYKITSNVSDEYFESNGGEFKIDEATNGLHAVNKVKESMNKE
jgi:hypothetical protein